MSITVLIDGTDVQSAKRTLVNAEGVVDTPEFRGDNLVVPYAHGETAVPKYLAAKSTVLYMALVGDDEDDLKDEVTTLFGLLPITASPGDPVDTTCTLTRRIVTAAGTSDSTADAEYIGGAEPNFVTGTYCRLTLRFKLLAGIWTPV